MNKWWICSVMSVFLLLPICCGTCFSPGVDYGTVDNPRTTYRTVSVPRTIEGVVDTEALLADVEAKVREALPGAYLRGFVFAGQARDLDTLDGRIVFAFVRVRSRILWEQVIAAGAAVETECETLRIFTMDETGHYPSTDRLELDKGLSLAKIASITYAQLEGMGFEGHEITLTRLQDDEWVVVCGEFGTLEQECRFEIDAMTGEITAIAQ